MRYNRKITLKLIVYLLIVCQLAIAGMPAASAAEPADPPSAIQEIIEGLESSQISAPPPPSLEPIASPTNQSPLTVKGSATPGATVIVRYGLAAGELQMAAPLVADESGKFETAIPLTAGDGRYAVVAKTIIDGVESTESGLSFDYDGTVPLPPRNVRWTLVPAEKSGVVIIWDVPFAQGSDQQWDSTISRYEIYRDSDLVGTKVDTAYPDMNLGDMQIHTYEIVAVDRAGNKSDPARIRAGTGYHDAVLVSSPSESRGFSNGIVYEQQMNGSGSKIAFLSNATDLVKQPLAHPGAYHLFMKDMLDNQTSLIGKAEINSDAAGGRLALDASGTVAAYVSDGRETADDTDDVSDIFLYDDTTSSIKLISEGAGNAYSPSISDNGALVVYERLGSAGKEVVLYQRSTQKTVLIGEGQHPTISGDGKTVFFTTTDADELVIYDVPSAKAETIPLTGGLQYGKVLETSSSSDGQTLAFTVKRVDASYTVYVYQRSDGSMTEIHDSPGESEFRVHHPYVSRDGQKLLFAYKNALGEDFYYGRANDGVVLYDIATQETMPIGNPALVTDKATMDRNGSKIAYISSDWEKPERRHVYMKCFQSCEETLPPADLPIEYATVHFQNMVNQQAVIGSSFTIMAAYEKGAQMQAIVSIRKSGGTDSEQTVPMMEDASGFYRASVTLPPDAVQLNAVKVARTDKPEIFKDVAYMPVKVAGQLKVTLQTAYAPLLTNTKIIATSKSKGTGNQITTDGRTQYTFPLGDAEDYTVQAVNVEGVVLGTFSPVAVNNGAESAAELMLTPAAKLDVVVSSEMRMAAGIKVLVEKAGTSHVYLTNDKGVVNVPGPHYQGDKVKVSILVDKPYVLPVPKELTLNMNDNTAAFNVQISQEGKLKGTVTDEKGNLVRMPLQVIFFNATRSVAATTGNDGTYEVDLPEDRYTIQVVSDQAPYYGMKYGLSPYVNITANTEQIKDLQVSSIASRHLKIDLSVKKLDEPWSGRQLAGMWEARHYGLSVTSNSANFDGKAINIMDNDLIVQGAAGDTVTVCADGANIGLSKDCKEVQLSGTGTTEVKLQIREAARLMGTVSDSINSTKYSLMLEFIDEQGYSSMAGSIGLSGKSFLQPVAKPGNYQITLVPNPFYFAYYRPVHSVERIVLKQFQIANGQILDLGPIIIPALDSVFAGKPGNRLETTTPKVAPGGIAKFRATYQYVNASPIPDAQLLIHVPREAELLTDSVVLNGSPVTPAAAGSGVYSVALGEIQPNASGTLYYQIKIADNAKNGSIDSFLDMKYRKTADQPYTRETLGSERLQVGTLELIAPKVVSTHSVFVRGTAPANEQIELYVDGKAVGQYSVSAGGLWEATIELEPKPESPVFYGNPVYQITAKVRLSEGIVDSDTSYVEYDADTPVITKLSIQQPRGVSVQLDTSNGVPIGHMSISNDKPVIFNVTTSHPERVANLSLHTGAKLDAEYDRSSNAFQAAVDPMRDKLSPDGIFVQYDTLPKPYALKAPSLEQLEQAKQQLPEAWRNTTAVLATQEETDAILAETGTLPPTQDNDENVTYSYQTPFVKANFSGKSNEDVYMRFTFKKVSQYTPAQAYTASTPLPYSDLKIETIGRTLRFSYVVPTSVYQQNKSGSLTTMGQNEHMINILEIKHPKIFGPFNKLWNAKDLIGNLGDLNQFMEEVLEFQDQVINSECHAPTVSYFNDQVERLADIAITETQLKYAITAVSAGFMGFVEVPAMLGFLVSTGTTMASDAATMDRDRIFKELKDEFAKVQKWRDDMAEAGVFPRCDKQDNDTDNDTTPPPYPNRKLPPPGMKRLTDMTWIYDPSGYVYEGMTSNRVKDAIATVFYKDDDRWMQWKASDYGQSNPLITDVEGRYAWDVPEGIWKVRYEKEGYVPAESAELTVLPPHFDVNIPLVSYQAPEVVRVFGRNGGESIQLDFSKPMQASTLNAANITVKDKAGTPVAGTIEAVAPETGENGAQLAMSYRFLAENGPFEGGSYSVQVSKEVQSYAGAMPAETIVREVHIDPAAKTPEIVMNLTAASGDRSIALSWEEASTDEADRIRLSIRKTGEEPWSEPVTIAAGERRYTFAGLEVGQEYEVKAVSVGFDDRESAGVLSKARTLTRPASAVDMEAPREVADVKLATEDRAIRVTWNDPADADFSKVLIMWKEKGSASEPRIGYANRGVQQYLIEGLNEGASYEITLITMDAYLNKSKGTVLEAGISRPDTSPPGDVSGLKASTDRKSITLKWTDPTDVDLDHVKITWNEKGSASAAKSVTVAKGVQTYTINDLNTGKVYAIEAVAFDASGNRSAGVKLEAKVLPTPQEPGPNPDPGPNPNPGPFPPGKDAVIIKLGKETKYEGFQGALQLRVQPGTFKNGAELQINRREMEAGNLPMPFKSASMAFELSALHGEQPAKPFILKLQYDAERMAGYDPRRIGLYRKTDDGKDWIYVGGLLNNKQHTVSVPVDRFGTYALLMYDRQFRDMDGHWSRPDVDAIVSRHVMKGLSETEFGPNRPVTRAELISIIVRALPAEKQAAKQNQAGFKDVKKEAWYYEEVAEAASRGLIHGSDGKFRPNDVATREEMIALVLRATGGDRIGNAAELNAYRDGKETSSWAQSAVAYGIQHKWVDGIWKEQLKPKAKATRAEAAALVLHMLEQSGLITEATEEQK